MTDAHDPTPGVGSPEKPTDEWVTGDEPMTGPQASYLATLAREAGEEVPDGLTKAQASDLIDRLQHTTGRGESTSQPDAADTTHPTGEAQAQQNRDEEPPA